MDDIISKTEAISEISKWKNRLEEQIEAAEKSPIRYADNFIRDTDRRIKGLTDAIMILKDM